MSLTHKLLEKTQLSVALVALLNQLLANVLDLKLSAKQAQWNAKGAGFIALHALFDEAGDSFDGYADNLAERIVQLGGTAQGTLQTVASQSNLSPYPEDIHDVSDHIRALCGSIAVQSDANLQAINTVEAAGDRITADLLIGISVGLDNYHRLLRSHFNT